MDPKVNGVALSHLYSMGYSGNRGPSVQFVSCIVALNGKDGEGHACTERC